MFAYMLRSSVIITERGGEVRSFELTKEEKSLRLISYLLDDNLSDNATNLENVISLG